MTPTVFGGLCDRIWGTGRAAGRVVDGDLERRDPRARAAARARDRGRPGPPDLAVGRGRLLTFLANPPAESRHAARHADQASGALSAGTRCGPSASPLGQDPASPGTVTDRRSRRSGRSSCSPMSDPHAPHEHARVPLDGEWRLRPAGRRTGGRPRPHPQLLDRSRRSGAASRARRVLRTTSRSRTARGRAACRRVRRRWATSPGCSSTGRTAASCGRRRSGSTSHAALRPGVNRLRGARRHPVAQPPHRRSRLADRRDLRADDRGVRADGDRCCPRA